ncbi:MAG: LamG-like jellyroll fold domain-containing protein [Limisphaerales bacterium]
MKRLLRTFTCLLVGTMASAVLESASGQTSQNSSDVSLQSGLKGYWTLDQAAGTRFDSSGNGFHLHPQGAVFSTNGKLNSAAVFDAFQGNQGLQVTNANARGLLAFADDWAVSSWVNHRTMRYEADNIFSKPGEINFFVSRISSTNRYRVHLYSGGTNSTMLLNHAFAYVVPTNTWQHVILQRKTNSIQLYVNGQLEGNVPFNNAVQSGGGNFWVGMHQTGWPWNGLIDEVGYWGRSLNGEEIAQLYGNGNPPAYETFTGGEEISPFIIAQPSSQSVNKGENVTFSVLVGGSAPLSYQWQLNGTNLLNATNQSLQITNVQLADAGSYLVTVSNGSGSTNSNPATLTVILPPAGLRIVSTNGMAGANISLPITLAANGNENSLGFSLNFNTQHLSFSSVALSEGVQATLLVNTNQTAMGRIGVALALQPDAVFNNGSNAILQVHFKSLLSQTTNLSAVSFGDLPIARQVSDTTANVLPATYVNGSVTLFPADLEGDVTPRPTGNRSVTITDWVQMGRFAAGLDTAADGSEFQRADCAPRNTSGDGKIKVTDWVQAGRYAAGLDPLQVVGGPTISKREANPAVAQAAGDGTGNPRQLKAVVTATAEAALSLEAKGDEAAIGFSLHFDASRFSYDGIQFSSALDGATVNVNTNEIELGRIGIALALQFGATFSQGERELLIVRFVSLGESTALNLTIADGPVLREVSDASANELPANYLVLAPPITAPNLNIELSGDTVKLSWPSSADGFLLQTANSDVSAGWSEYTQGISTNNGVVSVVIGATNSAEFYRLHKP